MADERANMRITVRAQMLGKSRDIIHGNSEEGRIQMKGQRRCGRRKEKYEIGANKGAIYQEWT